MRATSAARFAFVAELAALNFVTEWVLALSWVGRRGHFHREGFNPATGSPTATLLRLHPSRRPHRGMRQ
ncbi:hypothetical protein SLA2020_381690 [Shorea laevis]